MTELIARYLTSGKEVPAEINDAMMALDGVINVLLLHEIHHLRERMCDHKFESSYNNRYLTDAQREFYEENGYLLIRNLVDPLLLDECTERFLDVCKGKVNSDHLTVVKDFSLRSKDVKEEYLINKLEDFTSDEVLFKYLCNKPLVDVVESFIGPNVTAVHTMLINKPPGAEFESSRHPMHQDLYYFPFRPIKAIVAAWTAMERIDERNGCLFILPGSHKMGKLYPHGYPKGFQALAYHGVSGFEMEPRIYFPMEKGDTMFFHPLVLHGSGPNMTKGFRKSISSHYADNNCTFVDVKGTVQEQISKEVMKAFAMKGKPQATYDDVWKFKSRMVRGRPGNFQRKSSSL